MVTDPTTADLEADLRNDEASSGILERYRRGEVDLQTVLANMPESGVPPHILAAYHALIANRSGPDAPEAQEKKQRDEAYERFVEAVEQWRIDRGPGYVEAYLKLKQTGSAIDAGPSVFESDWFRALQDTRTETIRQLEEKVRRGEITSSEQQKLERARQEFSGDNAVSQNWKSLADDYRAILAKEKTGEMSEKEIREAEAEARQKIFEELDRASPELRERLLAEMEQHDPSMRKGYHAHHMARQAPDGPALPDTAPVSDELAAASTSGDLEAGLFEDDVLSGGITASATPTHDFNRVAVHEDASPVLADNGPSQAARSAHTRRGPAA